MLENLSSDDCGSSKITSGVNVYPSPEFVIVIPVTTPFPSIVAPPVAVTPVPTSFGGWIATFGAEVYPDPPLTKFNAVTFSLSKFTVAVALATCDSFWSSIFIVVCVALKSSIVLKDITSWTLKTVSVSVTPAIILVAGYNCEVFKFLFFCILSPSIILSTVCFFHLTGLI